jgi:hypothetical protein
MFKKKRIKTKRRRRREYKEELKKNYGIEWKRS